MLYISLISCQLLGHEAQLLLMLFVHLNIKSKHRNVVSQPVCTLPVDNKSGRVGIGCEECDRSYLIS